jgi:hypothetical protein
MALENSYVLTDGSKHMYRPIWKKGTKENTFSRVTIHVLKMETDNFSETMENYPSTINHP